MLSVAKKNRKAHRLSWELHHGAIPIGMNVLHKCDNPACVNPGHLILGSHADNMTDRDEKRRHAHGERHGKAKVNADTAAAIRTRVDDGESIAAVSRSFGVSVSIVHDIKHRKTWRHLPERGQE